MSFIKNEKQSILQIMAVTVIALLATSSIVAAVTTVGDDISTGGTLTVTGVSTLTGAVTAPGGVVGTSTGAQFATYAITANDSYSLGGANASAYMLRDGSLTMTGNLDLNSNNILNGGTYNGTSTGAVFAAYAMTTGSVNSAATATDALHLNGVPASLHFLTDGSRAMIGNLDLNSNNILNGGTYNGTSTGAQFAAYAQTAGSITLGNNTWFKSVDSLGSGFINMFKVNSSDQIEVGATMNIGTFEFAEDSGYSTLADMPVSSSAADGTEESYTFKIDGTNILKIKSLADGAGAVDTTQVVFPTSASGVAGYPTLAFGDGDTGFYEGADDQINISMSGTFQWYWSDTTFSGFNTGDPSLLNITSGPTVAGFSFKGDQDTGVGRAAADQLSFIAGGVEGIRITEDTTITTTMNGYTDTGGGQLEIPNGTTLPATCTVGQVFQDTDSDDCADTGGGDGALCICKSTNTWALISNF